MDGLVTIHSQKITRGAEVENNKISAKDEEELHLIF